MRRVVLFLFLAAACSDEPATSPPPVSSPDRGQLPNEDGGTTTDSGILVPENDASSIDTTTCKNGIKDGDETDVDCGGPTCSPCANGKKCVARRDCSILVCASGTCSGDIGCSDGSREGFSPVSTFPNIAACSGGWSIPGVLSTLTPACGRVSGNDSTNAAGSGCNVADLCESGWHVCISVMDVTGHSGGEGCANAAFPSNTFYATRTSGSGNALCDAAGANDLFGCGSVGPAPDGASCGVLANFSTDLCAGIPSDFACGSDAFQEANNVTKSSSNGGGVLCCRD